MPTPDRRFRHHSGLRVFFFPHGFSLLQHAEQCCTRFVSPCPNEEGRERGEPLLAGP